MTLKKKRIFETSSRKIKPMHWNNLYSLIIGFIVLASCSSDMMMSYVEHYNVEIDYMGIPHHDTRKIDNDSLVIAFYGEFDCDTVHVSINNDVFKTMILNTDPKTGWSGDIKTIKYKDIRNLGIRFNNGKLVYIEPPKKHYNIQVIYWDRVVKIRFHKRLPV